MFRFGAGIDVHRYREPSGARPMTEALSQDLLELLGEADFIRLVENFAGCRCYVPQKTTMTAGPSLASDLTAEHLAVLDPIERSIFEARHVADKRVPLARLASQLDRSRTGVQRLYIAACRKVNIAARYDQPENDERRAVLVEAVGEVAAQKLIDRYASSYLRVPMAREIRAAHYRAKGMSNPKIAVRLGMTETGLDKLFSRIKKAKLKRVAANDDKRQRQAANDDRPKRRLIRAAGDE